jgi:hypothetical protein
VELVDPFDSLDGMSGTCAGESAVGGKKRTGVVATRITIVCGGDGCEKSQTLRRSRVVACDGYMCRMDHGPRDKSAPGLVREIVMHAAGGFLRVA